MSSAAVDNPSQPSTTKQQTPAKLRSSRASTETRKPAKAKQALTMRAQGKGLRTVAKATGLDKGTITALERRNPAAFALLKQELAAEAYDLARLAQIQTRQELPNANARDAAVIGGIWTDKAMQLTNDMPVQRHEDKTPATPTTKQLDTVASAILLLAQSLTPSDPAAKATPIIDAQVENVTK